MRIKQQWLARDFTVGHQKVYVDIDFEAQTIEGWTDISVIPLSATADAAAFHCWQSEILRCEVDGQEAPWQHVDGLKELQLKDPSSNVHQHEQLRAKFASCNRTINRCDVHVRFPAGIKVLTQDEHDQLTHAIGDNGVVDNLGDIDGATPAIAPTPMTPYGDAQTPARTSFQQQYKPISIKLWFRCIKPALGLKFSSEGQYSHVYTTNYPVPCSTSLWLPCLDGIWERCTWEMSISIPRTLADIRRRSKPTNGHTTGVRHSELDDDDNVEISPAMVAICSADLYDEATHPDDPSRQILSFAQGSPVGASHMGFVVGPFLKHNLTDFREAEEDDMMGSSAVDILGYCLPGRLDTMDTACCFMYKAIDYFVREYGSYPYSTFQLCFLPDIGDSPVQLAGLVLASEDLLFEETNVDSTYEVTKSLTNMLATQWFGVNIVPRSWSDLWLTIGLSRYIAALFLRSLMGNNEYRYRLKQDVIRITQLDIGKPPISSREIELPLDPDQLSFVTLKAPVVLHMLERRMTKSGSTLGLQRVIPKILLQALSGEMSNGILGTVQFLRQCEKVAHIKLEEFAKQWITGYGYPRFSVVQRYNKKKMVIEMGLRQQQFNETSRSSLETSTFVEEAGRHITRPAIGPVDSIFTGPITVRIHEADGTPLEHVIELKEQFHRFEIPYNNKYRRRVRNRIRNKSKQETNQIPNEDNDNNDDDAEPIQINCLGDGFQTEQEVNRWHLDDWTKEDEDKIASEAFEWMRLDADFAWICTVQVGQPDYMFQSQLQQDRDVIAQIEALEYFSSMPPTTILCTILFRTIMDERYFYGIRQLAAKALSRCISPELDMQGAKLLLGIYRERYCFADSENYIPRENDFTDMPDYLVRRAIIQALVDVRIKGKTLPAVRQLLLEQLKYNDNSANPYSDTHYTCFLLEQTTSALIPTSQAYADYEDGLDDAARQLEGELDRAERLDRWRPSYQNLITQTCIKCRERLMTTSILPRRLDYLLAYTREEHYIHVRLQAFASLLKMRALLHAPLIKYIFHTLIRDPSITLCRQFGRLIKDGFGVMALSTLSNQAIVDPDAMVVNDDSTAAVELRKDAQARQTIDGALTALREEVAEDEILKQYLWEACNEPSVDFIVRRSLLNICRILYEAKQSRILKFKFPGLKARTKCLITGPGKVVIKKVRPFEQYQKKAPVKIKLKIVGIKK